MFSRGVLKCSWWFCTLKVGDKRPGTNTLLTWKENVNDYY